jgi:hypothetical protein
VYLCLLLGGGSLWTIVSRSVGIEGEAPRVVLIRPQSSSLKIAGALKDAGVIRSRLAFLAVAVARGTYRRLLP